MKSILKTGILLSMFMVGLQAGAQDLEVVGSAGTETSSSAGSMSYTVGEVVVQSVTSSAGTLNQGYQQGFLEATAIDEIPAELELSLYPNPASDFIIIESKSLTDFESISMYDMSGKLVWKTDGNTSVDNKLTINFSDYGAGNYIIQLSDSDQKQSYSYSVIKSH